MSSKKKAVAATSAEAPTPSPEASLPEPLFVDISEGARRLGFTIWAVRTLCWSKKIRFIKRGRKYFFSPADLRNYAERLLDESEAAL